MRVLCAVIVLIAINGVLTAHFYGGSIRWKSNPDVNRQATFFWKTAWIISKGPCGRTCDSSRIGTYANDPPWDLGAWKCVSASCGSADQSLSIPIEYYITSVNIEDEYEMGENQFTHTFSSDGPFYVGFSNGNWRALNAGESSPSWNVWTLVRFGTRTDTGKPNNSPLTAALPVFKMQFDCSGQIQLPLVDPDGDNVRCRWGETDEECRNVCGALPNVEIDRETCIFSVDVSTGYIDDGWYVGTIILEDYPRSTIKINGETFTPADALSKVPVQFMVRTPSYNSSCDAKPLFQWPTPEHGTTWNIAPTQSIGLSVYAKNELTISAIIADINVVTPPGVITSALKEDDYGRDRVRYKSIYWTPDATQSGANTICFIAVDTYDKFSDYRCVYIYANDVDECASNPCQSGGSCNNLENIYTCDCLPGTTGYNCEIDTFDNCLGVVCQNNGTCIDGYDGYTCDCAPGFTDTDCETEIDECASGPCFNGGNCTNLIDRFVCTCIEGYTNVDCGLQIDECQSGPCQNNGTCADLVNSYLCQCNLGFTGTHCEIDIDECASNPCDNGANCTDSVRSYTCSCVSGYTGTYCERDINECSSTPCQNSGRCIDQVDSYRCDCAAGYVGTYCGTEINECSSNPCDHGICTDLVNSFTCTCNVGWLGDLCDIDINECLSTPCENNGRCYDLENMYTCQCAPGFTGTTCSIEIDECAISGCMNGGVCIDGINSFKCQCASGFTGTYCQTNIDDCYMEPCINNGQCVDEVNGFHCICPELWYGDKCEFTDRELCKCESEENKDSTGHVVTCTCSNDYAFSEYKPQLKMELPCYRNPLTILSSIVAGIVVTALVLGFTFLVKGISLPTNRPDNEKTTLISSSKLNKIPEQTPEPSESVVLNGTERENSIISDSGTCMSGISYNREEVLSKMSRRTVSTTHSYDNGGYDMDSELPASTPTQLDVHM